MKKINKLNSGFTLVETLIAISIFTIALLGLMSVLARGIYDTTYAKEQLTGAYLAQEGIEYIKNMRDTYVLYSSDTQTGWTNFIAKASPACTGNNYCGFSNATAPGPGGTGVTCSDSTQNCELYLSNGNYNVDHSVGIDSGFMRKIQVTPVSGNANEVTISSTVSWTQGSGTHLVTFSENLFNWVE